MHPLAFDGAQLPAGPIHITGYWPNWNIARGLATFADGTGGVVLDGWGGLHPFTVGVSGPPAPPGPVDYWPNWDIARAIVLTPGSTYTHYSGYVLDGWGGIHPFGGTPREAVTGYWPNWDIARGITLLPGSSTAGYVADGWGGMHPFGGAPAVQTPMYTPSGDSHGLSAG
jgi:hypothetical protein